MPYKYLWKVQYLRSCFPQQYSPKTVPVKSVVFLFTNKDRVTKTAAVRVI